MSTLAPERPAEPAVRHRPLAAVLAAVGIPVFMVTLDNLVVTTALPVIRTDLGASLTDLQWFVNAYTLPFAAFLLTAAALGDRTGRRGPEHRVVDADRLPRDPGPRRRRRRAPVADPAGPGGARPHAQRGRRH